MLLMLPHWGGVPCCSCSLSVLLSLFIAMLKGDMQVHSPCPSTTIRRSAAAAGGGGWGWGGVAAGVAAPNSSA